MNQSVNREFSKLRSFIWPIHRHELRMLLPMVFILFLYVLITVFLEV